MDRRDPDVFLVDIQTTIYRYTWGLKLLAQNFLIGGGLDGGEVAFLNQIDRTSRGCSSWSSCG